MHKLRGPEIARISNARKERMHQLIDRWEIVGKHKPVLIESLRVLSAQSESCTLMGIRKQIKSKVRYVAFVDKDKNPFPQTPALPQVDAQLMLESVKELGIRMTKAILNVVRTAPPPCRPWNSKPPKAGSEYDQRRRFAAQLAEEKKRLELAVSTRHADD